jgi:uncharacterized phiE125 gp8 family phage protein
MALFLVTAPADEPITLSEAKQQVRRTDVTADDSYLQTILIPAVRERAEIATRRQLLTATWDLKLDAFPCGADDAIVLPKAPLISVTSISYVDPDGATQTWSSSLYAVSAPTGPMAARGEIRPVYGESYPSVRFQTNAVTVRFVAGYGTSATSVPPRLKMGMLLDLGTLYEHREDLVVGQGYALAEFTSGAGAVYRSFQVW